MSNSTQMLDNPIILDVSSSYGAILIGIVFSSILYGVSSLQSFIYSLNCDSDSVYLKYLVLVVWLADTANQMLLYAGAWPVFIKHYGSILGLSVVQPAILHHNWVSHIVIVSVQLYMAYRIYAFGQAGARSLRSFINAFIAMILALVTFEFTAVLYYQIKIYGKSLEVLGLRLELAINIAIRATAAFIDIALAVGMMFLLRHQATEFKRSRKLVQRLIIVVVGSGSLTAISAALTLILVAKFRDALWFCIFDFPLCSIYFNTLLVNLNSRKFVRNGTGINTFSHVESTGVQNNTLVLHSVGGQDPDRFIKIQKETDIKVDKVTSYDRI